MKPFQTYIIWIMSIYYLLTEVAQRINWWHNTYIARPENARPKAKTKQNKNAITFPYANSGGEHLLYMYCIVLIDQCYAFQIRKIQFQTRWACVCVYYLKWVHGDSPKKSIFCLIIHQTNKNFNIFLFLWSNLLTKSMKTICLALDIRKVLVLFLLFVHHK